MKTSKIRTACHPRTVSFAAIRSKLQALQDVGVDLDKIPLDWTIETLMQCGSANGPEILGEIRRAASKQELTIIADGLFKNRGAYRDCDRQLFSDEIIARDQAILRAETQRIAGVK